MTRRRGDNHTMVAVGAQPSSHCQHTANASVIEFEERRLTKCISSKSIAATPKWAKVARVLVILAHLHRALIDSVENRRLYLAAASEGK